MAGLITTVTQLYRTFDRLYEAHTVHVSTQNTLILSSQRSSSRFPHLINTTSLLGKPAFQSRPEGVRRELCLEEGYKISTRPHQAERPPNNTHFCK